LQQAPRQGTQSPAQQKADAAKAEAADDKAPREFVWSDNLRVDIPQSRAAGQATMAA